MRTRLVRSALCGLAVLVLAGCASPQTQAIIAGPGALPLRAEVPRVPFFAQDPDQCGPAAAAMALAWSGLPATPAALAPQVYTPGREGTLTKDLEGAVRRNGRLAVPVGTLAGLLGEIAAGHPVVVFQNLGLDSLPQWHFAVAVGYDLAARTIVLHSGREARRAVGLDTFERTWRRGRYWALLALPPGALPATADEAAVLRAAVALERIDHSAAAEAYAAILRRWPGSLGALTGLGNARYAAGDLPGAERAFRRASIDHPEAAAAWNNLAHVLGRLGQRDRAVEAAREAVRLAKGDPTPYQETLREVSGGAVARQPSF